MKKNTIRFIIISIVLVCLFGLSATANASDAGAVTIYNPRAFDNFELPVEGSTGYALVEQRLDDVNGAKVGSIPAGQMYTILAKDETRFRVQLPSGGIGWVSQTYTMINLADIMPSIRYNATNSYDSLYRSCGKPLALTGKSLYTGKTLNNKLGYEEYNMPVLYAMAKKIAFVQATALSEGYTLVLYEGFRPRDVQRAVNEDLQVLMDNDKEVRTSINTWGKSWFIAKSVSNHQKGFAIDVSLAKITETSTVVMDGRNIIVPSKYEELQMPTAMHELSPAAAAIAYGVDSKSDSAWRKVPTAAGMTEGAKMLQNYCVLGGLSPLSSEWWHFNDLSARSATNAAGSGEFYITGNVSVPSANVTK